MILCFTSHVLLYGLYSVPIVEFGFFDDLVNVIVPFGLRTGSGFKVLFGNFTTRFSTKLSSVASSMLLLQQVMVLII